MEAEEEVEVEWEEWVPLVPMDGIPDPGGDLIAPSQANSWVAFIKNDWNEDILHLVTLTRKHCLRGALYLFIYTELYLLPKSCTILYLFLPKIRAEK